MSAEDHLGRQFDDIIGRNFSPEEEAAMSTPQLFSDTNFDNEAPAHGPSWTASVDDGPLKKRDEERKSKHLGHGDTFKVDKWDVMSSNAKKRMMQSIWPQATVKNHYLP